jgi:hypothetical protein
MALALGTENKRQVIIASVLGVILVICGFVVFHMFFGSPSPSDSGPVPAAPPAQNQSAENQPVQNSPAPAGAQPGSSSGASSSSSHTAGNEAQRLSNAGIDPALHFDKLAQSEDVEYSGSGRNIFSAESVPVVIPKLIVPPRPGPGSSIVVNTPPQPPKPPAIDLRYFGYSQDDHKQLKAFFTHGDDIFMAKTGDIVDHRFKIGAIHPLNVEVTDLAYNNTQVVEISQQ